MALVQEQRIYTYEDYLDFPDDERWEVIEGLPYNMSPAPSTRHQDISSNLHAILLQLLKKKPCKVYYAPTDVVLSKTDIVQPDLLVVCDKQKITEKNIQGAPDLVIEILSPHTVKKDRWTKRYLYEKYGVKEYVIVDPDGKYAELYRLQADGTYDRGNVYAPGDNPLMEVMDGLQVEMEEVFAVEELDNTI